MSVPPERVGLLCGNTVSQEAGPTLYTFTVRQEPGSSGLLVSGETCEIVKMPLGQECGQLTLPFL
jgi:hypothetical protein